MTPDNVLLLLFSIIIIFLPILLSPLIAKIFLHLLPSNSNYYILTHPKHHYNYYPFLLYLYMIQSLLYHILIIIIPIYAIYNILIFLQTHLNITKYSINITKYSINMTNIVKYSERY